MDARDRTTASRGPGADPPRRRDVEAATWARLALGAVVAGGVVARIWPRRPLWLDEAQSVAIASLPLADVPGALREDGAPPLYYLVLHVWMRAFGRGDVAVRSLSITLSLLTLALLVVVAERRGGRRAATAVAVIAAASPFVIRYATETRMYAMVMLLVVVGVLAVDAGLRRPTGWRIAGVAAVTTLLLLTHYWAMYLVAVVAAGLVLGWRRTPAARRVLAGVVVGVVAWSPWIPTLRFQSGRTSTPWAQRAGPLSLGAVFDVGVRNSGPWPVALGVLTTVLVGLGVWRGRAVVTRAVAIRGLVVVAVATLLTALAGSRLSESAYAPRYTSVVVPLVLIVAAAGAASLRGVRAVAALLAVGVLGLGLAWSETGTDRTRSAAFVDPLVQEARAGDVIVYCPDQLGPAATRLFGQAGLDVGVRQVVFPPGRPPDRVDWIDYAARHAAARPRTFAAETVEAAGSSTVWLVASTTYPPTQSACSRLLVALGDRRPQHCVVVPDDPELADHGALWRFAATTAPTSTDDGSCAP